MLKTVKNNMLKNIDILFILGYALMLIADIMFKHPLVEKYNNHLILLSYLIMGIYIFINFIIKKLYKPSIFFKDKKYIFYIITAVIVVCLYKFNKDATFIRILIMLICVSFMDFKKFVKIDVSIKILLICTTIIMALTNVIPNELFYRENGLARQALGFKNPNQLSLYLMVLLFEFVYLSNKKKTYIFLILAVIIECIEYYIINTKTIMLIIPIFAICYIINVKCPKFVEKACENKLIKSIIYILPLLLTALVITSAYMYNTNPESMKFINKVFSGRISFCTVFFNNYGVSLLGNNIPDYIQQNVVLDNMYLKLLIKFGIIQYIMYIAIIILNTKKAYKEKQYHLLFIIVLLELYGMMETIVMIPSYNIFIIYFASLTFKSEDEPFTEKEGNKFLVCEGKSIGDYNASTKARKDIEEVLIKNGYNKFFIPTSYGVQENKLLKFKQIFIYLKNKKIWDKYLGKLEKDDTIVFQYPLINSCIGLENVLEKYKNKGIKIVGLIHDLDSLRYKPEIQGKMLCERVQKEDKNILNACSYIIAHNDKMKAHLETLNNDESKIIVLKLFDYLVDMELKKIERKKDDPIIIAGNLSKEKAAYLTFLSEIPKVKFNLYGKGYSPEKKDLNINYKGAFLPEELLNNLEGSYGLVWDGVSKEACKGGFGEYLKYNNPHKVSMYLAAGIPVIIWKDAALADFIENNKLGYTISSLDELSNIMVNITDEEYNEKLLNAKAISEKIKKGYFTENAMAKI